MGSGVGSIAYYQGARPAAHAFQRYLASKISESACEFESICLSSPGSGSRPSYTCRQRLADLIYCHMAAVYDLFYTIAVVSPQ